MGNLNKYGEIENAGCPHCGNPIKPEWVACPECGNRLSDAGGNPKKCPACGKSVEPDWKACPSCGHGFVNHHASNRPTQKSVDDTRAQAAAYICPGCGGRATAADGKLCPKCNAFVHKTCLSVGPKSGGVGDWFADLDRWKAVCPICRTSLGEFEGVEGTPVTLDGEPLPRFRNSPGRSAGAESNAAHQTPDMCAACQSRVPATGYAFCPQCGGEICWECLLKQSYRRTCPVCNTPLRGEINSA